jgi:hypothetical protein
MAKTIKGEFVTAQSLRSGLMRRAVECAAYTIPTILPKEALPPPGSNTQNEDIPQPYQNVGCRGVTNLTGKMFMSLFAPGMPWFQIRPPSQVLADPTIAPEVFDSLLAFLYAREMLISGVVQAIPMFQSKVRSHIENILVVGNSLLQLIGENGEYGLKKFRFDHWVQRRSGAGKLLWTICVERMNAMEMEDKQLSAAGLPTSEIRAKIEAGETVNDFDLYTKSQLQSDGTWLIQQEMNDKVINESQEKVNPFMPAGYTELEGEDYSRSFVEGHLGALRSLNGLSEAVQAGEANAAKIVWVNDHGMSGVNTSQFANAANGAIIPGRVNAEGKVPGLACIQSGKEYDMKVAQAGVAFWTQELGAAMLIESAVQPTGDRVTAYQSGRFAQEMDGATGGAYAQIADEIQMPLIKAVSYRMERDKLLVPLAGAMAKVAEFKIVTGVEALSRRIELSNLQIAVQMLAQIPGAMETVNANPIIRAVFEGLNIDTRTILKTPEQIAGEQQQQIQTGLAAEAGSQAIKSAGKIAEGAAAKATEETTATE